MPSREQYQRDPEKYRKYERERRRKNADAINKHRRARRQANPQKVRDQQNAWYARNKKDIQAQRRINRTDEDRTKKAAYDAQRYRENPEAAKKRVKAWVAEHPERQTEYRHRKRAARRSNIDCSDYISILLHDPCSYCGGTAGTIDHILPLSNGGTHEPDNLTAACHSCNSSKHTRSLLMSLMANDR